MSWLSEVIDDVEEAPKLLSDAKTVVATLESKASAGEALSAKIVAFVGTVESGIEKATAEPLVSGALTATGTAGDIALIIDGLNEIKTLANSVGALIGKVPAPLTPAIVAPVAITKAVNPAPVIAGDPGTTTTVDTADFTTATDAAEPPS